MKMQCNSEEILSELNKYKADVKNRLEDMVAMFARAVATSASSNTPLGSQASIEAGESGESKAAENYYNLYKQRNREYGIPISAGYHQGAWRYSSSGNLTFQPSIVDPLDVADNAYSVANIKYNLGEKFFIAATGPVGGPFDVNSNSATEKIVNPTIDEIMQVYQFDLKRYFDSAII